MENLDKKKIGKIEQGIRIPFILISIVISLAFGIWLLVIHSKYEVPDNITEDCSADQVQLLNLLMGIFYVTTAGFSILMCLGSICDIASDNNYNIGLWCVPCQSLPSSALGIMAIIQSVQVWGDCVCSCLAL
eukprot:gb/GECH01004877.1/.p1 GENE.gb/GECH01004877.1/~~gb/GECH01004877.1/.p1  ORF type:complete len:132 (+),score=14.61 gb/GECH01004877.1/:1-396(+)